MISLLTGKRIVNTRAVHQASILSDLLRGRGAEPLEYPCIAIVPPENTTALDDSLYELVSGHYSWLLLTSVNTVFSLAQRITALGLTPEAMHEAGLKVAAVGPATAEAVKTWLGLDISILPEDYVAESLAACLPLSAGDKVLLPESAIARPTLVDLLRARGAEVKCVTAYRTVRAKGGVNLPRLLASKQIDVVTFTSSSTVTNLIERLELEGGTWRDLDSVCIACNGPKTADTAHEQGIKVSVVASIYTLEGLIDAIEQFFMEMRDIA
jgi:uroporphyrinogen-III synthase